MPEFPVEIDKTIIVIRIYANICFQYFRTDVFAIASVINLNTDICIFLQLFSNDTRSVNTGKGQAKKKVANTTRIK